MSDRYLKLFTSIAEHPKFRLRLHSDADRVAYILALCKAKDAGTDGRFESREHLELVLGQYAGSVEALLEAGLLDEIPDTGELWIHDFEERQRPMTNAERQAAWRARHGLGRYPGKDDPDDDPDGGEGEGEPPKKPRKKTSPRVDNGVDNGVPNAARDVVHNADVMPSVTDGVMHIERRGDKKRVDKKRDISARSTESGPAIAQFEEFIHRPASSRQCTMIASMTRDHGTKMVISWMRLEALNGTHDLLKRTQSSIRRDVRNRNEKYEAARSRSEEERTKLEESFIEQDRDVDGYVNDELEAQAAQRREAIRTFAGGFTMKGEG